MASRQQVLRLSRQAITRLGPKTCSSSRTYTTPTSCPSITHLHVKCKFNQAQGQRRWHTIPPGFERGKLYDFNALKKLVESPSQDIILLDVREPHEYAEGYIPTALNVPISSQPDAFHLSPEDFFDRFGFAKPPPDKEIVTYCKAGVRSRAAAQLAKQNGYSKVGEYPGSWLDWQKNGGVTSSDPKGGV